MCLLVDEHASHGHREDAGAMSAARAGQRHAAAAAALLRNTWRLRLPEDFFSFLTLMPELQASLATTDFRVCVCSCSSTQSCGNAPPSRHATRRTPHARGTARLGAQFKTFRIPIFASIPDGRFLEVRLCVCVGRRAALRSIAGWSAAAGRVVRDQRVFVAVGDFQ